MLPLLLACMSAGQGAAQSVVSIPDGRKLIEWGWDEPSPAYMKANAARMDGYGFDGVIFHAEPIRAGQTANFAWTCWSTTRYDYADFAANVADLQAAAATFRRMTDNFLRFNVCPGDVDWFDDEAFGAVLGNAELAGRVAGEGRCKGLMFDIEQYNTQLFFYPQLKHKDTKTFAEYEAQVRARGRELMQAFTRDYPDITILLTFGYGITGVGGDRSQAPYGLLKNLLDGMLDAATPESLIVDAYEGAYSFRTHRQFVDARRAVRRGMLKHTANPAAYRKHLRVGFGVWMDNRYGAKAWHEDDFAANFFTPEEFEYSVFCGLRQTDRYVWVYTEHPKWWTNDRLPREYLDALRRVREPREIDDARYTGRTVKGFDGPAPPQAANQPGYDDESTFGDLKTEYGFVATLPTTWQFRTDEKRAGDKERWFAPELDTTEWRAMEIGKFWDEQGVRYTGDAWYRLTWEPPAVHLAPNSRLYLWFGAVDELATVWVNGRLAGKHHEAPDLGWDKRFPVDVTDLLQPAQPNTIAVKVKNTSLAGGIWKSVRLAVRHEAP